jgi:hypothetical protein
MTIRRILGILVIAGLVLAPLSRPVMADTAAAMPAVSMSVMADEMASDMPCCPTKAPAPLDCNKCVFMAGCMTKCFAHPLAALFHPFAASGQIAPLQNDFRPDGLGHPPPEHPPRTLV